MKNARKILILLFAAAVVSFVVYNLRDSSDKQVVAEVSDETKATEKAYRLFELANNARGTDHLLSWDTCLSDRATERARGIVEGGVFSHYSVSGEQLCYDQILSCTGYDMHVYMGENLTKGLGNSEELHYKLMQSPTHRDNILEPLHDQMGVGCYENVCVEFFAGVYPE